MVWVLECISQEEQISRAGNRGLGIQAEVGRKQEAGRAVTGYRNTKIRNRERDSEKTDLGWAIESSSEVAGGTAGRGRARAMCRDGECNRQIRVRVLRRGKEGKQFWLLRSSEEEAALDLYSRWGSGRHRSR